MLCESSNFFPKNVRTERISLAIKMYAFAHDNAFAIQ